MRRDRPPSTVLSWVGLMARATAVHPLSNKGMPHVAGDHCSGQFIQRCSTAVEKELDAQPSALLEDLMQIGLGVIRNLAVAESVPDFFPGSSAPCFQPFEGP